MQLGGGGDPLVLVDCEYYVFYKRESELRSRGFSPTRQADGTLLLAAPPPPACGSGDGAFLSWLWPSPPFSPPQIARTVSDWSRRLYRWAASRAEDDARVAAEHHGHRVSADDALLPPDGSGDAHRRAPAHASMLRRRASSCHLLA